MTVWRVIQWLGIVLDHSVTGVWHTLRGRGVSRAQWVRMLLMRLGPVGIKLGQNLATRPDVISPEWARVLSELQDRVPPCSVAHARQAVMAQLQCPLEQVFASWDDTPLAAASVAQVHAARLHSGEDVVVKILRPGIRRCMQRDMRVLRGLARVFTCWSRMRVRWVDFVNEMADVLDRECDLRKEAASASQLRRCLADDNPGCVVPKVYWAFSGEQILVMERVWGVPISHTQALHAAGVDQAHLARQLVHVVLHQVFHHALFHADVHAGNVLVDVQDPQAPVCLLVDFGIMGSLSAQDQRYLALNLWALLNRDYKRIAQLHLESGWVPADVRVDRLETAVRDVCEPMLEQSAHEVSCGRLLQQLLQVARDFQMEGLPQLVLLHKTLLNLEGMARTLDPQVDLWDVARPIVEQWMHRTMGWRAWVSGLQDAALVLPQLPRVLLRYLGSWDLEK